LVYVNREIFVYVRFSVLFFFKPGKKFDIKQKHVKNLAYIDYMNYNSVDKCVQ